MNPDEQQKQTLRRALQASIVLDLVIAVVLLVIGIPIAAGAIAVMAIVVTPLVMRRLGV